MSLAEVMATVLWVSVALYAVLGGADFGGGFWDLMAGSPARGKKQRALIESAIGPVWEANHVWLIFAIVVLSTGFPLAFTAAMTTLWIPLTCTAFGIILRGSGFVFRKAAVRFQDRRLFGTTFAFSSVVTPFFLGASAGAVASGRVAAGNAAGDALGSWLTPTSILGGVLAVATSAHLAAVFLTGDASRIQQHDLTLMFRRRAIASGSFVGVLALLGLLVLRWDANSLFEGLITEGLPFLAFVGILGLATLILLRRQRYILARIPVAGAVFSGIAAWASGQAPEILPGAFTIQAAAASDPVLGALLISLGVGGVLLIPSLLLLLAITKSGTQHENPE